MTTQAFFDEGNARPEALQADAAEYDAIAYQLSTIGRLTALLIASAITVSIIVLFLILAIPANRKNEAEKHSVTNGRKGILMMGILEGKGLQYSYENKKRVLGLRCGISGYLPVLLRF